MIDYIPDQFPISSLSSITSDKVLSEILDTTGGEKDCYRSASLCITVPGKIDVDGSNFPKWMVIFRGSFCDGDDWWSEDEQKQWHPDVVVSFQANAWMDTPSNSIWVDKC